MDSEKESVECMISNKMYAVPAWANALQKRASRRSLHSVQKKVVRRITGTYRTTSTTALLVLARMPPIELQAKLRQDIASGKCKIHAGELLIQR